MINAESLNGQWIVRGKEYSVQYMEGIGYDTNIRALRLYNLAIENATFSFFVGFGSVSHYSDNSGQILGMLFPIIFKKVDDEGNITGAEARYYTIKEWSDGYYSVVSAGTAPYQKGDIALGSESYSLISDIMNDPIVTDYEDSLLIYKNVYLMNGAKIFNEDGTII